MDSHLTSITDLKVLFTEMLRDMFRDGRVSLADLNRMAGFYQSGLGLAMQRAAIEVHRELENGA